MLFLLTISLTLLFCNSQITNHLYIISTYDSNIPVLINPLIACDDNTWSIPLGMHDVGEIKENGIEHIENKLQISYWYPLSQKSHRKNCGFDIILMAAGKRGSVAGIATENIALVCKWRTGLPYTTKKWRSNIDGTVQHEVSHLFGTKDVIDGHAKVACIMAYWQTWTGWPISYLYEYMTIGTGRQTGNWNSACCCQTAFNDNWNDYYEIYLI